MDDRLRAVCDLMVPTVREMAGLHEYDGRVQDLSPEGVRLGLAALERARRHGDRQENAHDEAHLTVFEESLRVQYGELELHRRDPYLHLSNLELTTYDREYAPAPERAAARARHLAAWPDAVDAAVASLDRLSAPVAAALLGAVRGLAAGLEQDRTPQAQAALKAHGRLVAHVARAAEKGDPDPRLGGRALARLMGCQEGLDVDLDLMARRADAERDRLTELLHESCRALAPGRGVDDLVPELLADHPDADGVIDHARRLTEEVLAFSRARRLAPHLDGECLVGPAPPSRRWSMAMMTWAAPGEADGPSWYHVTPPEPDWPAEEAEEWLSVFSATSLPAITVHEVAPGHFAHGRSLRRAAGPVRRVLHSLAFCEGWAHYIEEVCWEEGFRADDARFVIGVALEALVRVTRLSCAIGLHTGAMTVEEATRRFMRDAHLARAGAAAEARRGTFDAGYGRYTWGKLEIMALREEARRRWGAGFTPERFHTSLLELGSPPLGLIGSALEPH
ncbi:DUF885 family protein [Streptomyces thermolineatus]|uniref:DUF885 family protein n=1 Tax=Streptomyces thermolineatus TaxID=44033 RepID=UPI0031E37D9B